MANQRGASDGSQRTERSLGWMRCCMCDRTCRGVHVQGAGKRVQGLLSMIQLRDGSHVLLVHGGCSMTVR